MDPNAVRIRQANTQHISASPSYSAGNSGVTATVGPPHGGDMDPNEVRLRQARVQQISGSSPPVGINPGPNNAIALHGGAQMPQAQTQYGSSSQLINGPASASSGYNTYQTSQSPQSVSSGQYFPAQYGIQPSYPNQAQQPHQGPHSNIPGQVCHPSLKTRTKLTCQAQRKLSRGEQPTSKPTGSSICSCALTRTIANMAGREPSTQEKEVSDAPRA